MSDASKNPPPRRRRARAIALALLASGISSRLYGVNATVSIGNGTQTPDGSYLKAQNIANNLTFTSVTVGATSNIEIVDNIDLSTSQFGTPVGSLTLQAPTLNLTHNMIMSGFGTLTALTTTINMAGKITSGASLIAPSRVFGTATQMNVLSNAASLQQAVDLSSTTSPVNVQVSAGQYNESLSIAKSLTLHTPAGGATMLKAGSVSLGASATIDLADNKMIVTAMPLGSFVGGHYDGVTGLIQSGRGNGTWNGGSGIVTSMSDATTRTLSTLAVATAGDAAKTNFAATSVSASDVLVMYTYGGDANLDGKINVDDYGKIDFNINLGTAGWFNGDFNYDGKINVDDYGIIDFNVGIQGAPFATGAGLGDVTAVPEPVMWLALLVTPLLRRGRKRR